MEEKLKDYILKQYGSIGNLHNTLNYINEYITEMITTSQGPGNQNGQLCLMAIGSYERYREDWLYANGLEMSSEERDMWKQLTNDVVDMFRT